ncbi:hypothetical protein [Mesorhizobium sp. M0977]|uniref:hypothetical protein n=1 Tax=Mesorhizobium sp. M0977 TaxID=2957039 RepID=UPI00333D8828
MTRRGATKAVETGFGEGRLRIARSYLKAARLEVAMSGTGDIGNPAMSQIVNAAIAYADALTARFAGKINRADHAAVVKTMATRLEIAFLQRRPAGCGASSMRRTKLNTE